MTVVLPIFYIYGEKLQQTQKFESTKLNFV